MKEVYMTKFGHGKGNCLQACVASILEMDINDLPEFHDDGGFWFEGLYKFCVANNISLMHWPHDENIPLTCLNCYVIMCFKVEGVDDERHAVVGWARLPSDQTIEPGKPFSYEVVPVHDPNPHSLKLTDCIGFVHLSRVL